METLEEPPSQTRATARSVTPTAPQRVQTKAKTLPAVVQLQIQEERIKLELSRVLNYLVLAPKTESKLKIA